MVMVPITQVDPLVPAHIPHEKDCLLLPRKRFHWSTIESVSSQLQFPHCSIVSEGTMDVSIMVETDEMKDFVPLLFLWFTKARMEIAASKSNYMGDPCQLCFGIFLASRGKP